MRMAAIMLTVMGFTAYAAWHFRHPRLRAWFGASDGIPPTSADEQATDSGSDS
jgi:hypothetical protein